MAANPDFNNDFPQQAAEGSVHCDSQLLPFEKSVPSFNLNRLSITPIVVAG